MLPPGTRVGSYTIQGVVGRGGTATVYEAIQNSLGRRVALKLLDQRLDGEIDVERFRREGRVQAALSHPAILSVLEAGSSEHGLYLVTVLVDGPTLRDLIRRRELPAARAIELLAQVADGLDFAHRAGIVHRDIKPQNVLVGGGDRASLADFGLTRGLAAETVTETGQIFGTLAYLAPEVIKGGRADEASDRYAFATMAFQCLAGTVPFAHQVSASALYSHLNDRVPRISGVRPALPGALDNVFRQALAKSPRDRKLSAVDLVGQIRETLGEGRIGGLASPPVSEGSATAPAERRLRQARAPRLRSRGGMAGVAVAAGVVVLAAVLALRAILGGSGGDPATVAMASDPNLLGSDLSAVEEIVTVGCDDLEPTPESPACTVVQLSAPGAITSAPDGGAIVGWAVRGAAGELRLQVIRRQGGAFRVIAATEPRSVPGPALVEFPADVRIERGDLVGVALSTGSSIGVSPKTGATTMRWFDPLGFDKPRRPTAGAQAGFNYEVELRVEIEPGRIPSQPIRVTGRAAAQSLPGRLVTTRELQLGSLIYELRLMADGGNHDLDLFRGERRLARIQIHDAFHGELRQLLIEHDPDQPQTALIYLSWYSRDSNSLVEHYYSVTPRGFKLLS